MFFKLKNTKISFKPIKHNNFGYLRGFKFKI